MLSVTLKVIEPEGLHARPASMLVGVAFKYKSNIDIQCNDKIVNMKSIMGVMTLGACYNSEITIHINGEDEETAMMTIVNTIKENKFAE
ncbi:HPr family phosphocarrier protein [Vallitalea maricola]|uniref:Phosphocarrier protein HPr n=1 Tax=Vallitalea maricola TaxID=3074433 RepID=A0ACB5UEN0_9FIRM|nr:phosphocarrier protein HPr [Vallitalea sp. AN17-2]